MFHPFALVGTMVLGAGATFRVRECPPVGAHGLKMLSPSWTKHAWSMSGRGGEPSLSCSRQVPPMVASLGAFRKGLSCPCYVSYMHSVTVRQRKGCVVPWSQTWLAKNWLCRSCLAAVVLSCLCLSHREDNGESRPKESLPRFTVVPSFVEVS